MHKLSLIQPSLPRGMHDRTARYLQHRDEMIRRIKHVYTLYGFEPLETPAVERSSTLSGQYGQEGERLIFRILNSGNFLEGVELDTETHHRSLLKEIAKRALRYDLTVPMARYLAMHPELPTPFKRYQIQPVWRADKPQQGRYREFLQCDADIVGSDSLFCEAEILTLIYQTCQTLGIERFQIAWNHRGILESVAERIGAAHRSVDLCIALDKLDKIGQGAVLEELRQKAFSDSALELLKQFISVSGDTQARITSLQHWFAEGKMVCQALETLPVIESYTRTLGVTKNCIEFVPSLSRGLSYYTGTVFEVKIPGVHIGSVAGGGRYDNLTAAFGKKRTSGVGFSWGIDRLYEAMETLGLFSQWERPCTNILLVRIDTEADSIVLGALATLRAHRVRAETYPEVTKLSKQLRYAHKRDISKVLIIGSAELAQETFLLKDMLTGVQKTHPMKELLRAAALNGERA